MKNYLWAGITCALTLFYSCKSKTHVENNDDKQPTPVVNLVPIDTVLYTDYVAAIQAKRNVEIRSRIEGFLEHVYIDEGQEVKKGQVLFRISNTEYQVEVNKAKAALSKAQAEFKSSQVETAQARLLVSKNIISKTELDVAQARLNASRSFVEEARSVLDKAQTMLSYSVIKAPFNGRIDRILLKQGSLLTEGSLLTRVSDLDEAYAYFDISETEYLNRAQSKSLEKDLLGGKAQLVLANGITYPLEGVLEIAETQFEEQTGSIAFRARFANPERLLKHGASGKIRLSSQISNQIVVPQKAVFDIQDRSYVYVVNDSNKVAMTAFKAGKRFGHFYLVKDGIKPSTKVVYEGTQSLKNGQTIIPKTVRLDSLLMIKTTL